VLNTLSGEMLNIVAGIAPWSTASRHNSTQGVHVPQTFFLKAKQPKKQNKQKNKTDKTDKTNKTNQN